MDIGGKIKNLRVRQDLTQEELAARSELTKGFISQVERNLTSPSVATLVDLLDALGTNLSDFFHEEKEEKTVFHPEDYFESIDSDRNYRQEWIVPNAQKNRMEPIILTLKPGGRTREIRPFEGEELGYVIKGSVRFIHDKKEYILEKGDTFYLTEPNLHYLENPGKIEAVVLCVSTPPSF